MCMRKRIMRMNEGNGEGGTFSFLLSVKKIALEGVCTNTHGDVLPRLSLPGAIGVSMFE